MFGIAQKRLVSGLIQLKHSHCSYMGVPRPGQEFIKCDCKYGADKVKGDASHRPQFEHHEVGCGCPELSMALLMIRALTVEEYSELAKRAGVHITDSD